MLALADAATTPDATATPLANETLGVQTRGILQQVLTTLQGAHRFIERRRAPRHAYPYPLRMWPATICRVSHETFETIGGGSVVMGKHLSTGGLDCYSPEPIADRKVVICLESGDAEPIRLLTELTWCQFGEHGLYINGGRFLRALPSTTNGGG